MKRKRYEGDRSRALTASVVPACFAPQRAQSDDTRLHELWVPATFWEDHADRCPTDNGDDGLCRKRRCAGHRVFIRGSDAQLQVLRDDAAFYAGEDGPDECPAAIRRSAARTLRAIDGYLGARGPAAPQAPSP